MSDVTCSEKTALLYAYQEAALKYSNLLTELRSKMGKLPRKDYDSAYRTVELLRMDARTAQERLDLHVAEHGC